MAKAVTLIDDLMRGRETVTIQNLLDEIGLMLAGKSHVTPQSCDLSVSEDGIVSVIAIVDND